MIKFILEIPEEVVAKMEQFRVSCEVPSIEDLITNPLQIFVPKRELIEKIRCIRDDTPF
ncbi:MAG: hypothetical protein ABIH36_00260 [bacterium]